MPKTLTPDQIDKFICNFPKAFFPRAVLGFRVETTRTKNRFYVMLKHENDVYSIEENMHLYCQLNVHGLNKLIQSASPLLMLREQSFISIEDLIDLFKLDALVVKKLVVKAIRSKFNSKNPDEVEFSASQYPWIYNDNKRKTICLSKVNSFEELLVNVDLYAS